MNLDWHRLRAVVLQSDDWGLCAWVPDERAHRALAREPAFRSPAGLRYGRSTLESAADVRALAATLLECRGGDGLPPVWQANTIVAAPDFARLVPPRFEAEAVPLTTAQAATSRWARPGLDEALGLAESEGVWWAELHGLHHLPETAWLRALRRGQADARLAHEHGCIVCTAVESGGEYGPDEPRDVRARVLREAVARFQSRFCRTPTSFCPPDYRFDDWLESEAEAVGLTTIQGRFEREQDRWRRLVRRFRPAPFPEFAGDRFHLPARIGFEPRGDARGDARVGIAAAHRRARAAWKRGEPAILSTHRLNYAHLDARWSEAGRAALAELLRRLAGDGAVFLVDAELRSLLERGWSVRALGARRTLVRHYGVPHEPLRFPAPAGVARASLRAVRAAAGEGRIVLDHGEIEARLPAGEHVVEWDRA